jgi:phosphocarrier protein HPr
MSTGASRVTRELKIENVRGLHARASAKFVQTVVPFKSEIAVSKDGMTVSARSIMGLLTLAAAQGTTILIDAEGPDAVEAVDALIKLVAGKFGEE